MKTIIITALFLAVNLKIFGAEKDAIPTKLTVNVAAINASKIHIAVTKEGKNAIEITLFGESEYIYNYQKFDRNLSSIVEKMDLGALNEGIYFLKIKAGKEVLVKKITVSVAKQPLIISIDN